MTAVTGIENDAAEILGLLANGLVLVCRSQRGTGVKPRLFHNLFNLLTEGLTRLLRITDIFKFGFR